MTMDLGLLGGEMRMVMDDGVVYMKSPTFQDAGTEWVSLDPSKMSPEQAAQVGGFGAGTTDPAGVRGSVRRRVRRRGRRRGGDRRRPHGPLRGHDRPDEGVLQNFGDVVGEDVDEATKEQLEIAVDQFEALGIDERIPFEIWIDEDEPAAPAEDLDGLRRARSRGRRTRPRWT